MTPRLMGRALRLAELGWQVFPLRPGDKRPLPGFTNWEKRATTDPGQIIQWWTEAPYNIGIATGTSGPLVIDCDTSQDTGLAKDPHCCNSKRRPASVLFGQRTFPEQQRREVRKAH
jgi:Bifunctional DNA primase/polymerase, N-terminal